MEILLLVAVIAVAAVAVYVALTFNRRTRQSAAPLIGRGVKLISDQIKVTGEDLGRQSETISNEVGQAERRNSDISDQLFRELQKINYLTEQLGARQDQLGADVQALKSQVAGLSQSLIHRERQEQLANGTPSVPGKVYAERLRFFAVTGTQPQSHSLSGRWVRVEVERIAGELPAAPFGYLGDAAAIMRRGEHDKGFRDKLGEAASDYFADNRPDPVFMTVTHRWITQDYFQETAVAEVCNRIGNGLQVIAGEPLEKIGREIRLPEPKAATGAGIGAALILVPLAEPLEPAAELLEIVGVAVGGTIGLHPLALSSVKILAYDKFDNLAARGVREAAGRVFGLPDLQPARDECDPNGTSEGSAEGRSLFTEGAAGLSAGSAARLSAADDPAQLPVKSNSGVPDLPNAHNDGLDDTRRDIAERRRALDPPDEI